MTYSLCPLEQGGLGVLLRIWGRGTGGLASNAASILVEYLISLLLNLLAVSPSGIAH